MESSKRQARLDRRRSQQRNSQFKWVGYVVVAAVVMTGLLILAQQISGPRAATYPQKDGLTLGNPNATVTVLEFADFQCSSCLSSYNSTEQPLIQQYVDSGLILFSYQPVAFLGPESELAAEAAYCAADQEFFWEYHDVIFAPVNFSSGNQGGYTEAKLVDFARQVSGIDVDAFSACLASNENLTTLEQTMSLAQELGVSGTPTFVINGRLFVGDQPLSVLQQAIDEALAASGSN